MGTAIMTIGAIAAWLILKPPAPPTGYIGRDGQYDVYCGYVPDGHAGADYVCERQDAVRLLPGDSDED